MTDRENRLRAYRFQHPEWIPIATGLPFLDWAAEGYDEAELEQICLDHPILLPGYQKGAIKRNCQMVLESRPDLVKGNRYRDGWGCLWETMKTGMVGAVMQHALDDWSKLDGLRAPDPDRHDGMLPIDWAQLRTWREEARKQDWFFACGLPHGHTFLRLQDLRGYENLILDMADEEPRLNKLIELLTDFNSELIRRYVALEPDAIYVPEDLGMQTGPLLSRQHFHRYIAPAYERLTRPIKQAKILVHEHSDGFILPLLEDIIHFGGDIINLQDLVNGIDNIRKLAKGRIALDVDIDRQSLTVTGSPQDIDDHIKHIVMELGSHEGGLSLCYQPWPPTPPQNLRAVFSAMERYCRYWH
jgi:hypothetical protein